MYRLFSTLIRACERFPIYLFVFERCEIGWLRFFERWRRFYIKCIGIFFPVLILEEDCWLQELIWRRIRGWFRKMENYFYLIKNDVWWFIFVYRVVYFHHVFPFEILNCWFWKIGGLISWNEKWYFKKKLWLNWNGRSLKIFRRYLFALF